MKRKVIVKITILLLFLLTNYFYWSWVETPPKIDLPSWEEIEECYLKPSPYYFPLIHTRLIDCIEHYESSGDPLAVGQAGEIGCMQFMKTTYIHYCVKKYNLPDWEFGRYDCESQRICAELMLQDKFTNLTHWTTRFKCQHLW